MTDIPAPQSAVDARKFMKKLNADGSFDFEQVKPTDLDYAALYGAKAWSDTEIAVGYGSHTFYCDDVSKFKRGARVEVVSYPDAVLWMVGIVTATDPVNDMSVTVFVQETSGTSDIATQWTLQVTDTSAERVPTLGYSATSLQFGSSHDIFVGATVTLAVTDTDKLFNPGSHIIAEYLGDGTQYFRGIAQSYSSGNVSLFVTDVSPTASGTYSAWSVVAQDGPSQTLSFYSATSNSIASGTLTFAIQSGLFIPVNSSVYLYSSTSSGNAVFGKVTSYSGTTLTITVPATGVFGSGTYSSWYGYVVDAPPVYGSPHTSSITQVASATSSSSSNITVPAGVQAGDLLVLFDFANSPGSTITTVVPTGYTAAVKSENNVINPGPGNFYSTGVLSYRLATNSDAGSTVTGMAQPVSGDVVKILEVFRTNIPSTVLTLGGTGVHEANGSAPANLSVAASGGASPLAVVGVGAITNGTAAAGTLTMSPAADATQLKNGAAAGALMGWKLYNSAPADNTLSPGTVVSTQSGYLFGSYITMKTLGYSVGDVVTYVDNGSGSPTLPPVPITTQGDLMTVDSGGHVIRRGIGTAGQVPTVNAGATDWAWATPTAPLVLLNTLTANSSSSLDDTTSITSAYDAYMIYLENIVTSASTILYLRPHQGGSFLSANFVNSAGYSISSGTITAFSGTAGYEIIASGGNANGISGWLLWQNPNSSNKKSMTGQLSNLTALGITGLFVFGQYTNNASPFDGIQLIPASGNLASGKMRIYGIKTS